MMTVTNAAPSRADLAGWLADAAQSVIGILTAEYPTPAGRSYLRPILGPLAAGPRVVCELNFRLEELFEAEAPTTPAGLFALASYASALGWLTESLAELTTSVAAICTRAGIPVLPSCPSPPATPDGHEEYELSFNEEELAAILAAAEAASMEPGTYIGVLIEALAAASVITDAVMEISSGLVEDARYILAEADDDVRIGEGPGSLPTLVRSLLARMEAAAG